jgi:hypothetical protein
MSLVSSVAVITSSASQLTDGQAQSALDVVDR